MHPVLTRQLRRLGLATDAPPTQEQWAGFLERVDLAYTDADQERYTSERALDLSSAEMRQRFVELRTAQGQLVDASRKAGMADVAASVLHNVGNVLNSVNVSANMIGDALRASPRAGLGKSVSLLESQPAPGRFLDEDPRGKKLLSYLAALSRAFTDEQTTVLGELDSLTKNIEHIKSIIGQQLSAARAEAKMGRLVERVLVDDLLANATKVARATFPVGSNVVVEREGPSLAVFTDGHKVTQIVVNLLRNAADAVVSHANGGRVIVRTTQIDSNHVALDVIDDGVGIPSGSLGRIFQHGYTTKEDGHGFGLHSCACAALELGGTLVATSEGEGRGATFRLTLPNPRGRESVTPAATSATRAA